MLPSKNLDDRHFEEILEQAKNAIPKLQPEWGDHRHHDPGITLLEMFAWLMEMQQYYLNRITEKNERKFLQLMGVHPQHQSCATTDVTFFDVSEEAILPEKTRLFAGNLPFETEHSLVLVPASLERVLVHTESGTADVSSSNAHNGVSYYAFGQEPRIGNKIYLGFDRPLPVGKTVSIGLRLFEDYPVPLVSLTPTSLFVPSASLVWEYYGQNERTQEMGWSPLPVSDETLHLSFSGRVLIELEGAMKPIMLYPANDRPRFWLCATLRAGRFELAPRMEKIELNTVNAIQCETFSQVWEYDGTGQVDQTIVLASSLSYEGTVEVQCKKGRYWQSGWDQDEPDQADTGAFSFRVSRDSEQGATMIRFGSAIPEGRKNIRVIAYRSDFAGQRFIGESSGLPHQMFRLNVQSILPETFVIQVARQVEGSPFPVWEDWSLVTDFDRSGPQDRHFMLNDSDGAEIAFGNNEHGAIPERLEGMAGIRIISCQTGQGAKGNVQGGQITRFLPLARQRTTAQVTNPRPASGGSERETIDQAKRRMRMEWKKPQRAVTAEDYEAIALSTPGLRVARAKAIPLYKVGEMGATEQNAAAQMTVVIVPFSDQPTPQPSEGFLRTVRHQLEQRRLLTTEVHVTAPAYIKVTVFATIVVEPAFADKKQIVLQALKRYLTPLNVQDSSTHQGKGWEFGRPVYKSDLYEVLNQIEGVLYVTDLWVSTEGTGIIRDEGGDIQIPLHALVYSGEHVLELVVDRER
ncbi:putative baseplate assembly protein [Brevibacillus sp. HB1.2]|uniref:putative baseplate assembly protein n=1 Tax=Brevibacillus sp. HB1.2 TaxID=2738807 RepID=UPI0015766802|nr:putative baseplate assembly protein [Brevibacillus sp. HB1.2]NTU22625.1 putative baseplate assembly protein [Brevibacillus sp. HB1.2]